MTEVILKLSKQETCVYLKADNVTGGPYIISITRDKTLSIFDGISREINPKKIVVHNNNVRIEDGRGNVIREGRR